MKIWILIDGKKEGPVEDYLVRERIDNNEVTHDTLAWHEGLDGWKPVSELTPFRSAFPTNQVEEIPIEVVDEKNVDEYLKQVDQETALHEPSEKSEASGPPPLPVGTPGLYLWRRALARGFDWFAYFSFVMLLLTVSGNRVVDIFNPEAPGMLMSIVISWVILDGIAIHLWGTTPGKWILGLRIERLDRSRLGLAQSIFRSFRAWVLGMGMGSALVFITAPICIYFANRNGATIWDGRSGFQCRGFDLKAGNILAFICFCVATLMFFFEAIPTDQRDELDQRAYEMREQLKKTLKLGPDE